MDNTAAAPIDTMEGAERLLNAAMEGRGGTGAFPSIPTRAEILAAEQANDARVHALNAMGVGVDGSWFMAHKFDALITVLFGGVDTDARRAFDWLLTRKFDTALTEVEENAAKALREAKLRQGAGGLVVPGAGYRPKGR